MILSGPEILAETRAGRIHIDDFDPERLEPNSYGFRLADDILRYEQDVIDCFEAPTPEHLKMGPEGMVLEPGRFYLGGTMEAMGSPHYAATLYACRSASTLGIWIQFSAPLGHSGAVFPWTLEMKVAHPVRVYPGMVIGKLAFWSMQGDPTGYDGKYTGSTSAVASRLSLDVRVPD
ncbi:MULTISPECIES: deoxycytidine triphosphate deaminase [unclassified Streptomyces]|uniref:Deoxycytidine triphosphate deaminase n=2 Tax=Streptomyces TaxID=1883 RepID=A0ABU2RFQ2_9ACTN|nr:MULTISPECIES: deoxycytidine triphosphate deaminase [unclassified Streptomyces]MYR67048.1 deoxycytidine triphosphate deaminase [Streptomyces sp. SID4939]MYS04024.1 deoxycytidine triphosphate deaminase [Streptomyces sp. SID4940]MYT66123.1 deoxycytidine triphosphate deaminase [Streptomyces sp. SID8357]MYT88185.1 deoxycytidine triphosphate deaminase [Streptomyces sp. SID8360]MYU36522.1 deoxycytidine triphosphate deaminase [Streptomyces sp. SID8358]MYW37570.1 deoxycytidine triphosphate deaminas